MIVDGQIRMSIEDVNKLELIHLISGLDDDGPAMPASSAMLTTITGYTEWVTEGTPVVTLGWDWQMLAQQQVKLCRVGSPRSNLMLQDALLRDLGHEKSELLLEVFIDGFDWQAKALKYIECCYAVDLRPDTSHSAQSPD